MELSLKGINVLILGGDKRELELYSYLKKMGAQVLLIGFDAFENDTLSEPYYNISKSIKVSQVIITPLTGIESNGTIYAPYSRHYINIFDAAILKSFTAGSILIAGYLDDTVKKRLKKQNLITCETREMDEISILNAVPTAEGAIQYAMEQSEITIHNSASFVLGYGRCGKVLATTLQALGAQVTVLVRRPEILAWVEVYKMKPLMLNDLPKYISKADFIFNTIPFPILTGDILCHVKKDSLIIEIASYPGGIDMEAAKRLNIHTCVLPGLPGKIAPKTAGTILCKVYPSLILSLLKGGVKNEV